MGGDATAHLVGASALDGCSLELVFVGCQEIFGMDVKLMFLMGLFRWVGVVVWHGLHLGEGGGYDCMGEAGVLDIAMA